MLFIPKLGLQGNIEIALKRNQQTSTLILAETTNRQMADIENREAVEQALTDQYLDGVQAQQDITELQLEILGG